MGVDEVREMVGTEKIVIGTDEVTKFLRKGELEKVYVANNTQSDVKKDLEHYANISDTDLEELEVHNEDLGVLCRKPFSVSVLGKRK